MKLVGSLFLFWLPEVVQDKEPTEFFLQEFRSRILGDRLVEYRDPIRLSDHAGKTSVPGLEKHLMLRMITRPAMAWTNGYWTDLSCSDWILARSGDMQKNAPLGLTGDKKNSDWLSTRGLLRE